MDVQWARDVIEHCVPSSVPVFVKQWGLRPYVEGVANFESQLWPKGTKTERDLDGTRVRLRLKHKKGGDAAEWPEWAMVREHPMQDQGRAIV